MMLRIRDSSGDGTVASKLVELGLNATQAQIETPSANGQILLELGYRTLGGDFITLEYSFIDLGLKHMYSHSWQIGLAMNPTTFTKKCTICRPR